MAQPPSLSSPLVDRFGRHVNYLRISVTDRCDFRCVYCMAEDMSFLPRSEILSLEEIGLVARSFVAMGVTKIRITGGEPLVRNGVIDIIGELGALPGLRELVLTTNGSHLPTMATQLRKACVSRVNISLDTLKSDRFRALTRVGELATVLRGLDAAIDAGFDRIKLNAVILKHRNHDEAADLVAFAIAKGVDISFIEEMPLGQVDGRNRAEQYYSSDLIKKDLEAVYDLLPSTLQTGGPSRYYQVNGASTRIGFISPHSHNFCSSCNRVRMTTEGRLLLCLGNEHSVDLKQVLRNYPGDEEKLREAIGASMAIKPERHEFNLKERPVILRHMSVTGG